MLSRIDSDLVVTTPVFRRLAVSGNELIWLGQGEGEHGAIRSTADEVAKSLTGAFRFVKESTAGAGLRAPQVGAIHAILAQRSTESLEPILVVMPTGTGKTETMLGLFACEPKRTLVVVPSDALRTQTAEKFASFGVLPAVGAIAGDFRCPVVLILKEGLSTPADADASVGLANVVVATAQVLTSSTEAARSRLGELVERLVVDEAHHVAARTWRAIADQFAGKEIVQFTATPFREDGKHLGGTVAYAYPLRLAQKNGFFARVNYHAVVDMTEPDRAVATAAISQLRADLAAGKDHLLMARVSSIERAKQVLGIYETTAGDLRPVRIDTAMAESTRQKHRAALFARDSRIVVCVNMLGEGFDLPALKVAAIHDPQRSLAVTLQFIGRFARVGDDSLGEASAFVPLQVGGLDERLRRLYSEDADWNEVLRDVTEQEVGQGKARSEFEAGFTSKPREVAIRSIQPKMSTVTYRSSTGITWEPEKIYDLFDGRLLTTRLGINNAEKVVWWVSEEITPVRWGDVATFSEQIHHLYVVHLDEAGGYLYINSTNNDSMHDDVARAIGGKDVELLKGDEIYRVLALVQRRIPTNVGLLDSVSRSRRFSLHVGQDVLAAWTGEGGTKMKTNIFAHGFSSGRAVSFGASRKGRVWSHQVARDVREWMLWARQVGPTVTDNSIRLDSVMSGFLLPEAATVRPAYVPLSIEWPHELLATISDNRKLVHAGQAFSILDTELRVISRTRTDPLAFEVVTPAWTLEFEYVFSGTEPPTIHARANDAQVETPKGTESLSAFVTRHGLFVTFEDEVVLMEQGFLLRPNRERRLFPTERIETLDWSGIDIQKESQGAARDQSAIQHRAIEALSAEATWEIVLDDDATGELADIAMLRRRDDELDVLLAHCKFSTEATPGARIADFYEVCGQAMKMNRAKSMPELLTRRLLRREVDRQRAGRSGLITGDLALLTQLTQEAGSRRLNTTVVIVQPGLAKTRASDDIRALLGATERFLAETHGMKLRVIASA